MAKSKRKRKPKAAPAKRTAPAWRRPVLVVVIGLLAAGIAWLWYGERRVERAFLAHAERGQTALAAIVRPPGEGSGHLAPGQRVNYLGDPPTSGVHDPDWVTPGGYGSPRVREKLVHSLEHGMVVIYYDAPPAASLATLKDWAGLYGAPWSGIVLVRKPGLGEAVILTAWRRLMRLDSFDAAAAAAFIDAFRGRGPEHPVR